MPEGMNLSTLTFPVIILPVRFPIHAVSVAVDLKVRLSLVINFIPSTVQLIPSTVHFIPQLVQLIPAQNQILFF